MITERDIYINRPVFHTTKYYCQLGLAFLGHICNYQHVSYNKAQKANYATVVFSIVKVGGGLRLVFI